MDTLCFLLFSMSLLTFSIEFSTAADILTPVQSVTDGKSLVSKAGTFELGFFSPGASKNRYLGIWYKNIPVRTVVWVANRDHPINDSSGMLLINSTGIPVLLSSNKSVVWSPNSTREAKSPILQLLDSGNLVLRDEKDVDSQSYLWQSFDYPTDTMVPGMKIGWDLRTGLDLYLSAWKNSDDPSTGELRQGIELNGYPQSVVWKGSQKFCRSGPWNGLRYSGLPELKENPVFSFKFVSDSDGVYYTYELKNKSLISRIVINETSNSRQRYIWIEEDQRWSLYASMPKDHCDNYGLCGAHGICVINESPVCQCLKRFQPKSPEEWNAMDWSRGCVRNHPLNCSNKDGFVKYSGLKLPDTASSWMNKTMNLKECRAKCLNNCSCMAYTNSDIRAGGSGCAIWFGDLIDIRQLAVGGQDLYIRMSASELETHAGQRIKIGVIVVAAIVLVAGTLLLGYYRCKSRMNLKEEEEVKEDDNQNEGQQENLELPLFDLATIDNATDSFSIHNKVGEGGFGAVYKGTLVDGQEIAVKRLSINSRQGLNEFKNEVILIAKLQHRNLVKLLGCCLQGEEKMLIYEYMPNKSLDFFIFDEIRGKLLDWSNRFHIICGIARGLLYLHQDSRLRIIHRDLKASNILLDNDMNPKISDFGLARLFGGDQTEAKTNRVVGTYGYMAPEYAIDGQFSVKSDVFSFGILLLEIISGKRNRGFYNPNHSHNLIGRAWRLWKEGRPLELVDAFLEDSCSPSEVLRCFHVSLLCVQQRPEDRPSMSSVVLMLSSDSALPQPKQPGFFADGKLLEVDSSSGKHESCSTNEITITLLEPR